MKSKGSSATNADDLGSTLTRGVGQVTVTAHDTIDSLSDVAKPAVDRMTSGAHNVVDQVAGAATQAAKTLGATTKNLQRTEQKLTQNAREYVREHPIASVGIALAAGYVVSRLFSSR